MEDATGESFDRLLLFRFERVSPQASLLVTVEAPAFLRNLKFLRKDGPAGVQAWVRTTRGTRVLSGNASAESLFGSDFLSSDFALSGRPWVMTHEEVQPGLVGLETPSVSFPGGKQILFLRATDNLVVRSRETDSKGMTQRVYEVLSWESDSELAHPRVVRMTDSSRKSLSTLTLSGLSEDRRFPTGTFAPGGL